MNEYVKDWICGSFAGVYGALFAHPFDTIKVLINS